MTNKNNLVRPTTTDASILVLAKLYREEPASWCHNEQLGGPGSYQAFEAWEAEVKAAASGLSPEAKGEAWALSLTL